jgi:lipopolysaccharide/colanic/teichoic acid biosynthesis glycosyltransferase
MAQQASGGRDAVTLRPMSDLEPRRRSALSRKERAERAYKLVLATGGLAVLTIVLLVLAVVGIVGAGPVIVAGLATAGSGVLLRRALG